MTGAAEAPVAGDLRVVVIIPALNEADAVGRVVGEVPRSVPGARVMDIIVVDNGSCDGTASEARRAGAKVVAEPVRGYGRACLAGLSSVDPAACDVIVFMDADAADDPTDLPALLRPIVDGDADLVIGSRTLGAQAGRAESGALLPQARLGNLLACALIRLRWGVRFTDLGPFRAIRQRSLARLGMVDSTYGWTVEMQAKAARAGLRCVEAPVAYRRRVGKSKISGTIVGSMKAGAKILWTIGRLALTTRSTRGQHP
jgi:glycosyltransferase involved in cell wall biosynthesis